MKTLIIVLLLTVNLVTAQTESNLDYFPHNNNDMWQYFYSDGPLYVDTAQVFNHYDSTDANGNVYITQTSRYINPIKTPAVPFADTMRYKIDTLNQVWGRVHELNNVIAFKLNAEQGDQWILKTYYDNDEIMGYEMARVDLFEYEFYGNTYKGMSTVYYFTNDSTDTSGLARYGQALAKGLGCVWLGGGETPGRVDLIGAVIDGVLYGDTTNIITSVKENNEKIIPQVFELEQNYPNPFNPTTLIKYQLPKESHVIIKLYDMLGREVTELVNNQQAAGYYEFTFDGSDLASGMYIYKLTAGNFTDSKKLLLLK